MKKTILLTLAFSFLVFGIGYAVVGTTPASDSAEVTVTGRGQETAVERVEENLRRIEERTGRSVEGLRQAIERILRERQTEESCYFFENELNYEDTGEEVEDLQRFLRSKNYFRASIDGVYGWDSARALYEYQKEVEVEPTEGLERMGFVFGEDIRDYINENYKCIEENDTDDEDDRDEEDSDDEEDENDEDVENDENGDENDSEED